MALKGRNLLSSLFASSRSSLTCTYKCGNACFGECENKSDNPYFGDQFSRRTALRAGSLLLGWSLPTYRARPPRRGHSARSPPRPPRAAHPASGRRAGRTRRGCGVPSRGNASGRPG